MMYIDVLVELKAKQIDKTFTYLVPDKLQSDIDIGKRVLVPFGKQKLEGFILNNYIVEDTSLVNNLEPRHFYEALSAFSKINLMIDIGYQSANTGIYIDTTKVRKLYIDETEVESFIAD